MDFGCTSLNYHIGQLRPMVFDVMPWIGRFTFEYRVFRTTKLSPVKTGLKCPFLLGNQLFSELKINDGANNIKKQND